MQNRVSRRSFVKSCLAGAAALKLAAGSTALLSVLATPEEGLAKGAGAGEFTQTNMLMGTFVTITVAHRDAAFANAAIEKTFAEIRRLEGIFSRHNSSTALSLLNAQGSIADAPVEFYSLLREALAFGNRLPAFDITVAPLVDFLAANANRSGSMSVNAAELAAARALVDRNAVRLADNGRISLLKPGMALTLDGIAKGHITDLASALLLKAGANNHLINSGGDIYAHGLRADAKPWMVGVEDPFNPGQTYTDMYALGRSSGQAYTALCSLGSRSSGKALATSGTYRNYYDSARVNHHLINPSSGQSSQGFCSITVSAPNARLADALATALGAMPAKEAAQAIENMPQCAALFIASDGRQLRSSRWV